MKESLELATSLILNFRHSVKHFTPPGCDNKTYRTSKVQRIFSSSFLQLTRKPQRPYVTQHFARATIYIHTLHCALNLEIISPGYESEGQKGGRWVVLNSPRAVFTFLSLPDALVTGCGPLYCNSLFKSAYPSAASVNHEQCEIINQFNVQKRRNSTNTK